MESFNLKILAANRAFYEGPCFSLRFQTEDGSYGILAHHQNLIAAIVPGPFYYRIDEEREETLALSSGLIKVENNDVLILVDTVERPDEIDENRAKMALDEAREKMLKKKSAQEYKLARAKLAREMNRLKVKHQFLNK